jgi:hypothetical protein
MAKNADYFDRGALERARGQISTASDWPEYNGGILMPKRVHIRPNQYIYRFASSKTAHTYRTRGCWWIEFEVLRKIAIFAREQGDTPRDAARYFLALPWSWTSVDRLLRARLVEKVDAYRGLGKPAAGSHSRDAGTRFIAPYHVAELYQLFIPGMDVPGFAEQVLTDVSDKEIWAADAFA